MQPRFQLHEQRPGLVVPAQLGHRVDRALLQQSELARPVADQGAFEVRQARRHGPAGDGVFDERPQVVGERLGARGLTRGLATMPADKKDRQ